MIGSKRYHWDAKKRKRDRKRNWLTADFTRKEQNDRESYPVIPSPRGKYWRSYVYHRLEMMEDGLDTYATRQYARLELDKYIESTRAVDKTAASLTNKLPSLIFIGAAEIAANSIIRIRKYVRCPGVRKLVRSFKKLGNCYIRYVDEFMTSQTCAKCFGRFDRRTRSHRFKVCQNCKPNGDALLPDVIISKKSNRQLQLERFEKEAELLEHIVNPELPPVERKKYIKQALAPRLVSKIKVIFKTWVLDPVSGDIVDAVHAPKTVWHRDIVAAKCILYKGTF